MSSIKRLAQEINGLRRLALGHATSPQLANASVDGGDLEIRDGDGNRVGGIGLGDDGGFVIDYSGGPKPPRPRAPKVSADAGLLRVEWDGGFEPAEGEEEPLITADLDLVEIHASMDENFVPDRVQSFGGAYASLEGGSHVIGPLTETGTYYVRLVARSKAGKFSEPSAMAEQMLAIANVDEALTDAWITGTTAAITADGKNGIWRGPEAPEPDPDVPFKDGDIWFEMNEDGESIPNIFDESTGTWVSNRDARQSAIERVQEELRQDLDAVITDGSGTKNFFRPTAPAASEAKEGDLWFDSSADGKNTPHVFQDGAWVSAADQRVADIKAAQDELRQDLDEVVENGVGTSTHYTPTMPSAAVSKEGDLWFDPSDNNKPYIYQNGEWVTVRDSFTQPGAGENVFALLTEADTTKNALDNQWASVPGFSFTIGSTGVEATVPADAGAGTVTSRLPLAGSFNSAGEWQLNPEDTIPANGLGLGGSGTLWFYSPGAAPTARIVLNLSVPGQGLLEIVQPLVVKEDRFGSTQTHSMSLQDQDLQVLGIYPSVYAWSLFLEVTVDSVPGNTVDGSVSLAYAVGGKGIADKAITTGKIAAGAITAESGIIGSIDAGTITVGTLAAARFAANTINADSILVNGSLGTTIIKDGAITTSKIKAGAITADSGIIGSINAGTITVGEMDGARIKAQSIYSDKLLIGGDRNMVPNGDLSIGSAEGWPGSPSYRTSNGPPSNTAGVPNVYYKAGEGTVSWSDWGRFPVQAGDTLVFECWVKNDKANAVMFVEVRDQDGAHLSTASGTKWQSVEGGAGATAYPISAWVVPTTWTKVVSTLKVGGAKTREAVFGSVYFNHQNGTERGATPYLAGVKLYKQVGATLIENGAISTEHIRTGAITAESGIIGSIDANVITVGKIMGNQLDADAINGKTITGAKIRTASSGSRVELTHNGLKQYNSLGATIVDMTSGSFTLQGGSITGSTIKTASSGSRVEITSSGLKQYDSKNAVIADMTGGSLEMKGVLEQQNTIARMRMGAMWADNSPGIIWSEGEFAGQSNPPAISTVAFSNTGPNEESSHSLYIQGPNANSQVHLGNKWWRMRAYGDVDSKYGWMYQGVDFTNIQNNYTSTNMSWMTQNKDSSTIGNRVSSTRQASLHLNANSGERVSLIRNTSASGGQWLNMTDDFNVFTWSHPSNSGSSYLRLEDRYAFLGSYDGSGDAVGFLRMNSTESVLSSYKRSMEIWGNQEMMLASSKDSTSAYMKSDMIYYRTYSGSANVYITGNKVLGRSTSSRRYKDNIETIPRERYENALLSLDFRTWQAKAEIAEHEEFLAWREENPMCPTPERFMEVSDDGPGWEAGMIAEELYEAGLDFLVPLDHYGRPESVNYDRIGPALIPIVREQRDRIEVLESRLEALETA